MNGSEWQFGEAEGSEHKETKVTNITWLGSHHGLPCKIDEQPRGTAAPVERSDRGSRTDELTAGEWRGQVSRCQQTAALPGETCTQQEGGEEDSRKIRSSVFCSASEKGQQRAALNRATHNPMCAQVYGFNSADSFCENKKV